jgi:acyl carrier protein
LSDSIQDDIRSLMGEIIEVDPGTIQPDDHLVKDLGADSMAALELLAKLEQKYDIVIEPENLPELVTLGSTVTLVRRLTEASGG